MSCMFGHIAEYSIRGFYTTWFEHTTCLKWAENVMHGGT
jgi:hypothetical protein